MTEISNMTEAMQADGFVGQWYSVIHMGRPYRIQIREDMKQPFVYDNYMHAVKGEEAEELTEKVKEYRNEE
jgi:hypothetical protein